MELGRLLFRKRVFELRDKGMEPNYIARQIVDDHYRKTGRDIQNKQHIVEELVLRELSEE